MSKPLVTVVIGNYNYARFIAKAIESVENQTYRNWELLIVDDGSTDNSIDIIQSKSYIKNLTPIFLPKVGRTVAFNTAFEKAKGKIICFLDSDDYFKEDKLAKIVDRFVRNPDCIQVSHQWRVVNAEGSIIDKAPSGFLDKGQVKQSLLSWGRYGAAVSSACSYRRDALQKVFPFDCNYGQDTYINATIPFYGDIDCINEPLMFYRLHGSNVRAHSKNLNYRIEQRRAIASFINSEANKLGIKERFELSQDPIYQSLKILDSEQRNLLSTSWIIWRFLRYGLTGKIFNKDYLKTMVTYSASTLYPSKGKEII